MLKYPRRLRAGTANTAVFERRPDLYSIRSPIDATAADAVAVMEDDAATKYAVYKGRPQGKGPAADVGPVYSAADGGPLAVPTGRVFIRLAKGISPRERRDEIAAAGYEIERTLGYAPNAAWLRPTAGGVAAAMAGLGALEKLDGVEHVEPQMLLERALKGG